MSESREGMKNPVEEYLTLEREQFARGMRKLQIPTPRGPFRCENLWVTTAGESEYGSKLYRLENVPFFADGLALGDVVEAVDVPGVFGRVLFAGVEERGGNRTIRVIFGDGPVELQKATLDVLGGQVEGLAFELGFEGFWAINVPGEKVEQVEATLKKLEERVRGMDWERAW